MRWGLAKWICGIWLATASAVFAFPYALSTGTFSTATSPSVNWTDFNWTWSDQDAQDIQVNFTGISVPVSITNVSLRLAYPQGGPSYLTIASGTLTPGTSNVAWQIAAPLAPSNIPPDRVYYAEFFGTGTNGATRSLAKGRISSVWSLFSISAVTSWVSRTVSYTGGAYTNVFTGMDPSFPYPISTGMFDPSSAVSDSWSAFLWRWSDRDYRMLSASFSGLSNPNAVSNVYLRLAFPQGGPTYLTIRGGQLTYGSNLTWALPYPLPPSNVPPDRIYFAEFLGVGANGESRSLAKGRIQTDWSLFSISNSASWVPLNILYAGTNGYVGPIGPQGPPGTNGVDGAPGSNGVQGIQGPPGTNGVDGINTTNQDWNAITNIPSDWAGTFGAHLPSFYLNYANFTNTPSIPSTNGLANTNDYPGTWQSHAPSYFYLNSDPSNFQGQITSLSTGKVDKTDPRVTLALTNNPGWATNSDLVAHTTNTAIHVSASDRTNWNGKATLADVAGVGYITNWPTPAQIGAVATNDPGMTNARPWNAPDYNSLSNKPFIPSTNGLANTNDYPGTWQSHAPSYFYLNSDPSNFQGQITSLSTGKVDKTDPRYLAALTNNPGWLTNGSPGTSTNLSSYNNDAGYVTNSGGAGNITNIISTDGSVVIAAPGGPQPDLSVTNAVAGWSGYNATQQVAWVGAVVGTNLLVTGNMGALWPMIETGIYYQVYSSLPAMVWTNVYGSLIATNIYYPDQYQIMPDNQAGFWLSKTSSFLTVTGSYYNAEEGSALTVVYGSTSTGNISWKSGFDGTNWTIAKDGVVQVDATNVATKVQGAKADAAYPASNPSNYITLPTNVVFSAGQLDGTNGVYFYNPATGSNYWILLP